VPSGKRSGARRSKLDPCKPRIHRLLADGLWNAVVIQREAHIQRVERPVWDAIYALQKAVSIQRLIAYGVCLIVNRTDRDRRDDFDHGRPWI
jgi:hypothetical protein